MWQVLKKLPQAVRPNNPVTATNSKHNRMFRIRDPSSVNPHSALNDIPFPGPPLRTVGIVLTLVCVKQR
jgi:hypothetical protein